MSHRVFTIPAFLCLLTAWGISMQSEPGLEKGKIIDRVICQNSPSQSYALYLPREYSPEKSWPILYAFDPSARGKVPVEQFKEAAERLHYIVAGSHNAQNGPWEDIFSAMHALWDDSNSRLNIDKKSVYTTGFSGGARAAAAFSKVINHPVAGIIGCGAGLPIEFKPEDVSGSVYYGTVGIADFNYREMVLLDKQLIQADIPHRIHFFEGTHSWPPSDVCASALEWMEIMRMKQNVVPKDQQKIDDIYSRQAQRTEKLEKEGKVYLAVLSYKDQATLFSGLKDTTEIKESAACLEQSEAYKKFLQNETKRNQRELNIIRTCGNIFDNIEKAPEDYKDMETLFAQMSLYFLLNESRKQDSLEDKSMASRLLHLIFSRAAQTGKQHLNNNDPLKAVILYEIAVKASEENTDIHKFALFRLAQAYALNKDEKSALEYLDLAVKNGFSDLSAVQKSPYFEEMRESQLYKSIIEKMKKEACS